MSVAKEISQWPPTTIIMIDSKTHTIMVEACDFCGKSFHPTYACPYHRRYGNYRSSSYASPQPDFCMSRPSPRSPQQERRTIKDMEKDMISDWLSPSTKKYSSDGWSNSSYQQDTYSSMRNQPSRDIIRFLLDTEQDMNLTKQELDQWIEQRDQEAEEEIQSILQKISAETMSPIPLESVEVNEATPIEDDWNEPEETIEASLHEPDISIVQNEADEAEKEIDVILERPEKPQKESKEDQPLVLVKPPTLPCIFVEPYKGVVIKERSQIFYATDTFVSADDDAIYSYVLEVPDELLNLNEGMTDEVPKAIDVPFIVFDALLLTHQSREPDITVKFDILILVLNLEDKIWDKFGGVIVSELQFENHAVSPIRLRHIATAVDLPTDTCASPALSVLMRMKFCALLRLPSVTFSTHQHVITTPPSQSQHATSAYHHFHPMRGCHVAINSQL
ncbi:hypothetical protein Sjap_011786 [Stephania japonica]|uniref:Uncharacterized protein n=1 Tax=Stephania japonica TaxID=461633 RepID=A0AAP0JC92_9MAGN